LRVGQVGKAVEGLVVALQAAYSYNLAGFAVSFCFGDFSVLLAHVHIPCGVGGEFFTAIMQALVVPLELLGASPHVLLPLRWVYAGACLLLDVFDEVIEVVVDLVISIFGKLKFTHFIAVR